jgi:hypothetical protein
MTGQTRDSPNDPLEGLSKTRRAGSDGAGQVSPLIAPGARGAFQDPKARAFVPDRMPGLVAAEYQYRLGTHRLVLSVSGATEQHEAAVGRAEAEFMLVVEGPLLVLGYRFGEGTPWSWTAPFNWHFTAAAERVAPAAIALTPETYARLWATLWITLVDTDDGRVCTCRAVVLRPEFTHALHGVLREQALRPFRGAIADGALSWLRSASTPRALMSRVRTKCAAVWDYGRMGSQADRGGTRQCGAFRKGILMAHDPSNSIVITDGSWMHIRHIRVYHRRYPEIRGEGRSLADAASHLMSQLARGLDFAHGREREAVVRAVADVQALLSSRPRHRPGISPQFDDPLAASESSTPHLICAGDNKCGH